MPAPPLAIGGLAPPFSLPDPHGALVSLEQRWGDRATVVLFTSNHCPYSQAWEDRIIALARDYGPRGVAFTAINSNATQRTRGEGADAMAARAQSKQYPYPYLLDDDQSVARQYGATRTPELFVFDAGRRLRFHGAVDDNYDDPAAVRRRYAADALDAILAGREPEPRETEVLGCPIRFAAAGARPSSAASAAPPAPSLPKLTSPLITADSPSPLIYYSLRDCPTCVKAKAALQARGIPFVEREVDDDELWQQEVFRLTGQTTVPVFVRGDMVEVGFEGEPGCHF